MYNNDHLEYIDSNGNIVSQLHADVEKKYSSSLVYFKWPSSSTDPRI